MLEIEFSEQNNQFKTRLKSEYAIHDDWTQTKFRNLLEYKIYS